VCEAAAFPLKSVSSSLMNPVEVHILPGRPALAFLAPAVLLALAASPTLAAIPAPSLPALTPKPKHMPALETFFAVRPFRM
jgi:hypothetical protein